MKAKSIDLRPAVEMYLQYLFSGPLVQSENEGLHDLREAPMAGFFTYGEFGKDQQKKTAFHSGACCWVILTEKKVSDESQSSNFHLDFSLHHDIRLY